MTDLSMQDQFDLDRAAAVDRAMVIGTLPEAPLAMPVQVLEHPVSGGLVALLRTLMPRMQKAGQ